MAALSAISFPFIPTWLGIQHMFAHISQLGVELKYAEDCNVDNIEALDCF